MFGPHEAWLSLGAIAFYLGDSMALLYADELLLERTGARWMPRRGSALLLGGRRPLLPDPLAPQRPLLQLSLRALLDGDDTGDRGRVRAMLAALAPLRALAIAMLLLFALMPGLLYVAGTGALFLAWFACVYVVALAMAAALWRRRAAFGLSRGAVALLAFECVACAPLAINIVRRVSRRLACPPLAELRTLLDPPSFEALCATIDAMLDERALDVRALDLEAAGVASGQLDLYRQRLRLGAAR